jgi:transcription elongation factor Elf1
MTKNNALSCPECGGRTSVVDTRANGAFVRRRRQCTNCGHRMSSLEYIVGSDSDFRSKYLAALREIENVVRSGIDTLRNGAAE